MYLKAGKTASMVNSLLVISGSDASNGQPLMSRLIKLDSAVRGVRAVAVLMRLPLRSRSCSPERRVSGPRLSPIALSVRHKCVKPGSSGRVSRELERMPQLARERRSREASCFNPCLTMAIQMSVDLTPWARCARAASYNLMPPITSNESSFLKAHLPSSSKIFKSESAFDKASEKVAKGMPLECLL